MIALFSLFTIIFVSIIIVRIGAIALELTGIPPEVAAFQAQSAFSGTGFTTTEAEAIVNHPGRRKIIRILIMFGSAGLTSSVATLILTFVNQGRAAITFRGIILLIGLLVIFLLARSKFIYNFMKRIIKNFLQKHSSLVVMDYQEILGLSKGYGISKFKVKKNSWIAGKTLKSLDIIKEGILILNINRKIGKKIETIGAPTADVIIQSGDELVCYGKAESIKNLSERLKGSRGDKEHEKIVNLEKDAAKAEKNNLELQTQKINKQ